MHRERPAIADLRDKSIEVLAFVLHHGMSEVDAMELVDIDPADFMPPSDRFDAYPYIPSPEVIKASTAPKIHPAKHGTFPQVCERFRNFRRIQLDPADAIGKDA